MGKNTRVSSRHSLLIKLNQASQSPAIRHVTIWQSLFYHLDSMPMPWGVKGALTGGVWWTSAAFNPALWAK